NGFAGLVRLLEAQGHEVELSRSKTRLQDEGLLVLTPPIYADGERIAEVIRARRYDGPTILILPKWPAMEASGIPGVDARRGWVLLGSPVAPRWIDELEGLGDAEIAIGERRRWEGISLAGTFPEPDKVLSLDASSYLPLVTDERGDPRAGYLPDRGSYPGLDGAAGMPGRDPDELDTDDDLWPVVVVAEPDLMNNYGLADRERARLAHAIVDAALEDYELPIVFDLTLPGLGRGENLLTLAFRPPFLAATLARFLPLRPARRRGPGADDGQAPAGPQQRCADRARAPVPPARPTLCGDGHAAPRRGARPSRIRPRGPRGGGRPRARCARNRRRLCRAGRGLAPRPPFNRIAARRGRAPRHRKDGFPMTLSLDDTRKLADSIRAEIAKAIVGQEDTVEHLLIALVAQGHVLLEGPPGTAKTFLAQCFAASC